MEIENFSSKICIENLIKVYGEQPSLALRMFREGETREAILKATGQVLGIADVSLTISPGELFVIIGLSGSGKSTLVRCFNRLVEPTSGRIYIDDENIVRASDRRMRELRLKKISMVFQQFGLLPHKTILENVEYGLKIAGISEKKRRQKAFPCLETVGLSQWSDYFPANLSGGMKQRVGLARALATDADILLMDEPFSALDPLIRRQMQEELLQLQTRLNKTIVFISHDIQEALKLGDRIAVMKEGCIVQVGTPEEIITQPANDYVRAFIQDINYAKVLKVSTIVRREVPFILDRETTQTALKKMQHHNIRYMYVVDDRHQPIGILNQQHLQQINSDRFNLSQVMETNFSQVKLTVTLDTLFPLFKSDLPIAVVDTDGKFAGVVEVCDLFARLSQNEQ
ncbi:MAG: glycine betaine/L-proline ABC transporter ATP-binding protein [Cyanobacteriota bacterium]|nr:glycine betaine/L-proline ABC transporter ATP-binding protein [Cyanobacteriota bacterium]